MYNTVNIDYGPLYINVAAFSTRGFAVTGAPSGGRQEAEGRSGGIACAKDILELQYLTRFNVPDRPKSNFLPAMACNFTSWATPNTAGDAAANEKNQYAHGVPYNCFILRRTVSVLGPTDSVDISKEMRM